MRNNLLYNALYGSQVSLRLVFQVLFARQYGTSLSADVYFASQVIFIFLSTTVLFFTELFMQHYNDLRNRDPKDAERLYQAVFCLSVLLSLATTIISRASLPPIAAWLLPGFQQEHYVHFISFANTLLLFVIISPLVDLNNSLINSELRFGVPYLLGLLYPASNIAALLLFSERYGLNVMAIAPIVSGLVILALQQVYIMKRLRIRPALRLWHPGMRALITTSFAMRLGHQLYALKEPLTTSILSTFPIGAISMFSYAQKIISIIHSVANAPVLQVYMANVSRYVSQRNLALVRLALRETVLLNLALFLICVIPLAIALPGLLRLLFAQKFSADDIVAVETLFLALIPHYVLLSIEAPFSTIIVSLKRALNVILTNAAFVTIYALLIVSLSRKILGIYAIPAALFIAQAVNFYVYVMLVNKLLRNTPANAPGPRP